MTVTQDLFGREQPKYVKTLLEEEKSLVTLCRLAGKELLTEWKNQVITKSPFNQVLAITSQAEFASSHEQVEAAGIVCHCIDAKEIPPYLMDILIEQQFQSLPESQKRIVAYDFGAKCLVSLGLFDKALIRRYNHGGPKPDFYRDVGKKTLRYAGLAEVSKNFSPWESFLKEFFC